MVGTKRKAHGMIHSGIHTPGKQATAIIPLENYSYSREKTNWCIFYFLKERNQHYEKLCSLPELQSKEKASSPSPIGFESSQVSTENDLLSNFVSKLNPEELSKLTNKEAN